MAARTHALASTDEAARQVNLLAADTGAQRLDNQQPRRLIGLGREGSWTFQTYGSAALGEGAGRVYAAHTGVGYFICENLSLNVELITGRIDLKEGTHKSASVYGSDLLLRWYFDKSRDWTAYLEVGAGMHKSSHPFPAVGSHFNFRPQWGIGFTYSMSPDVKLLGGVRWLHISNANKDGSLRNPGFDGVMPYLGMMVPF